MTADRLFDIPPVHQLTARQTRALDAITNAGYDGLHTDELGAILHNHPDDQRCEWCGSAGQSVGVALRRKGLAQQRRRKAPGGDTVTVWTVAGKLAPPRADREGVIPF